MIDRAKDLPANCLTQLLSIPQPDRSIEMTMHIAMASGTEIYTLVGHPALTRMFMTLQHELARLFLSQNWTPRSFKPEMTHWPSCKIAMEGTQSLWPVKSSTLLPNRLPALRALLTAVLSSKYWSRASQTPGPCRRA